MINYIILKNLILNVVKTNFLLKTEENTPLKITNIIQVTHYHIKIHFQHKKMFKPLPFMLIQPIKRQIFQDMHKQIMYGTPKRIGGPFAPGGANYEKWEDILNRRFVPVFAVGLVYSVDVFDWMRNRSAFILSRTNSSFPCFSCCRDCEWKLTRVCKNVGFIFNLVFLGF